jgi:hypothetical protein
MQASKDDDVLDQHSLLPSMTDDPKLWMVKCVAGAERGIVTQLMQKYITFMNREKPLSIFSAFCQDLSACALRIPMKTWQILEHWLCSTDTASQSATEDAQTV